jgi:UDP-N-acetyl-L-fucosamine synthase
MQKNKKVRVMTVMGTRPEIIKLSSVLKELDQFADHTIVYTNQNSQVYLKDVFFTDLNLRIPDYQMDPGDFAVGDVDEFLGALLPYISKLVRTIRPDVALLYGDTHSCLCAIVFKRLGVPIVHIEGGNRCHNSKVPEETNRRIVDHLSSVNLTLSNEARENLIAENYPPNRAIVVGSLIPDVYAEILPRVNESSVLKTLGLTSRNYYVVSVHRAENVDNYGVLEEVLTGINELAMTGARVIVTAHPRFKDHISKSKISLLPGVELCEPFGLVDFLRLQVEAKCVISDSGSIWEDSSFFGFPAVTVRIAHERIEGEHESQVIVVNPAQGQSLKIAVDLAERYSNVRFGPIPTYSRLNTAAKVVRTIFSYALGRTIGR